MNKKEHKYLTFSLNNEDYGLDIFKVKEIIGIMDITPVPQTPDYFKGVINLRGKIIPIIDLRIRFGMEHKEYTEHTCIIVIELKGKTGLIQMGIIVDTVTEVSNIDKEDIESPPSFGTKLNTDYILGIAKGKEKVKILLDIEKVLTEEELIMIEEKGGM